MTQASNRIIVKNTVFLYVRMMVVILASLITTKVVLSSLGASDYGIYNVTGGLVTFMAFLNGALAGSSSRFLTYELGKGDIVKLNNTFSAALALHIGVAILVVIVGETLGLWLLYNKLVIPAERLSAAFWVLQFSIITTVFNFTQVPFLASVMSHENMAVYAFVGLYDAFAKLAIAYLIYISPIDNLVFYALLLMINAIAIQFFYVIYTHRHYTECNFKIIKDVKLYKTLISYCGWELFGGLASVCQGQGLSVVLNMFFGPVVNAARAIVAQIQGAVSSFVSSIFTAARPQVIKRCAVKEYDSMYDLTFSTARYGYMMMLAAVLPICFEIDFILDIWLGENTPEQTNVFTIIVLCTSLSQTFHTAALMPYHAIGKIKIGNLIGGGLMILSLPVCYCLYRVGVEAYWGFVVIFITNCAQQFITWGVVYHYVKFSIRSIIYDVYLPCLLVTLCCVTPVLWIRFSMDGGLLRFVLLIAFAEASLVLSGYFIGLKPSERVLLKDYIHNIIIHERS